MVKVFRLLFASGLLMLVVACSSDKPVHKPAPTPEVVNKFEPQQVWSASIGDGVGNYYSQLQPTVANSTVYAASRGGEVKAFSLKGKQLWDTDVTELKGHKQYTVDGSARLSGGILAAFDMVFVGSENAQLFALDAKTGKLKWRTAMPGEVVASPSVGEGILAVVTNNGHLVAVDPQSGNILWNITLDLPSLTLRGKAVPVISNGVVILGRSNGSVSVFSVKNGQQVFSTRIGQSNGSTQLEQLADVDSQPLLLDNELFAISYNGSLVALNLQNGRTSWKRSYAAYRDMAIAGSELLISDRSSHLVDLDRFSGSENWQQTQLSYRNITAPAVVGNYVLVGDSEGYLYWISRDTGKFVAKVDIGGDGLYVAPVVTDKLIIIQTRDGKLIAYKRA
ncbi:outer membrane protein assembly factor BamB [Celerinatantimonas diazotrophica]|uniref:Outer membrane protein assembly factor BamB n=1 Tax=Celerinatantimonas diazotrophica TaxID=412034 RepID=A0A4V2PRQ5_9GAMM|nr:outer membrane protein assembly factor BamB [Celerinatantimonas diazotrophica]TCK58831.1 Beta-barrel assembly machine subunit BamB [Celerinatantimonas diazotrophica]CAG9297463.1 Outer membrane protein assembly factor BamB [Celerinatantimonas diazotrophica]